MISGYALYFAASHIYETQTELVSISKNMYLLDYMYKGNIYSICIPIRKGPTKILRVVDACGYDRTLELRRLLGPNENFHDGISNILKCYPEIQQMKFYTIDDRCLSFSELGKGLKID